MKMLSLISIVAMSLVSNNVLAGSGATEKQLYLNKNLGFNVKGYNYNQKELPCNVDSYLVNDIVSKGKKENINITTVGTGDTIAKSDIPVLAIDIDHLALGKKGFNFGKKGSTSVLPSMKVTVGLFQGKDKGGDVLAKHSCAILTLNQVSPANSGILDMGTYGMTVCDATRKCLHDLSKDIVDWVAPQL